MRFACSASVMYVSTLPSPCFTKPHFCVQPRKPRQRGGRRAGDFRRKRDIWDVHGCPKYRVFLYYLVGVCGADLSETNFLFIRLSAFLCVWENQSALNAHGGGRKRKRGAFRFRRGAARCAPALRGVAWSCLFLLCNFRAAVGTVYVVCHMYMFVHCGVGRCVRFFRAQ